MSTVSPAYLEIIDFIAAGATPEAVSQFRPSPEAQRRISDLLEREKECGFQPEEKAELTTSGIGTHSEDGKGEGPQILRVVSAVSDGCAPGGRERTTVANIASFMKTMGGSLTKSTTL